RYLVGDLPGGQGDGGRRVVHVGADAGADGCQHGVFVLGRPPGDLVVLVLGGVERRGVGRENPIDDGGRLVPLRLFRCVKGQPAACAVGQDGGAACRSSYRPTGFAQGCGRGVDVGGVEVEGDGQVRLVQVRDI